MYYESNKKDINCLCVSVESMNTQLKTLWVLKSIGIVEKKSKKSYQEVANEFQATLKFLMGRFETSLLWKDFSRLLKNNLEA